MNNLCDESCALMVGYCGVTEQRQRRVTEIKKLS